MVLAEKDQMLTLKVLSVGYRRLLAVRKLSTHSVLDGQKKPSCLANICN